jgi:hypothetical protein
LDEEITTGKITADMTYDWRGWLRLQFGNLDQWIDMETVPRHFGGRQWYCICPRTERRVSVLWKPPGSRSFASRQAWGQQVAYGSEFETSRDRALSAAQAIRCKLGGQDYISIDDEMPPKPKWMRWRTHERITRRCEANEATCNLYLLGFLARLKNQH